MTQQKPGAEEAKQLGVVNEIAPADQLLLRVRELADSIAAQPPLTTKYTRIGFTQRFRRVVDQGIGYGLAPEGITAAKVARASSAA